jgi:hypothetical protein
MAFVWCSEKDKTRALKEVASMLKARSPEVATIYVSFNDAAQLNDEETDALAALRRRIAYYSLNENSTDFD